MIRFIKEQFYTISLYLRLAFGTLAIFLIARYLSVHDFGLFTSYKSIATFCLLFANLEFNNYILVSSKANVKEIKLNLSLFLLNAFSLIILIFIGSFFFNIENRILFFLIILRCFFDATFFALILPYFQASKNFTKIAIINTIYSCFIALIVIISYVLKLSLLWFLVLNVIVGFINFVQCSKFIKIRYFIKLNIIKKQIKKLDKSILFFMSSSLTSYLYSQIPSLYTALFMIKEQAALFFAALTIAQVTILFTDAQAQRMIPELINTSLSNQKKVMIRNCLLVWGVYLGVIILFVFCGKYLLKLIYLKPYYINSHRCLIIFSISNLMIATSTLFGTYITAINQQPFKVKVKIETSIFVIIALLLLRDFGINGVAFALFLASTYTAMRYLVFSINDIKKRSICNE